jgi:O-succinylbenzoic acid--CoA ligase
VQDWLRAAATDVGDRPFLIHADGAVTTFSELELRVQEVVGSLRARGLGPGDVIAVKPRNDAVSVARMFAVPRTGAAALIINARLGDAEAGAQVAGAGAVAAFDGLGGLTDSGTTGPVDPFIDLDPDANHSILFTSGSSGTPKAVRLTWGNLEASAAASASVLEHNEHDRWYAALPIHHVGGLSILIRSARERSTVFLEPSFDPYRAAELLVDGSATLGSVVASMLRAILDVEPGPFRGVKALLVGGGATPLDLLTEAVEAGLPVLPTYGMTETASQVATRPLSDALHPGSTAVAVPGADLRIGPGSVIEVRGPMVSPGYLGEPERSGEWFRTADVGTLADGRLTVLGRADDVIISGGENVHPVEIERVLAEVAGVVEVVVVGVPDPKWGEEVVAVVEGDVAPGALERHARYHLAGYKVPKRWVLVGSMPRLGIGKPDRVAIRALASAELPVNRTDRSSP